MAGTITFVGSTPISGSTINVATVTFDYEIDDVTDGVSLIEVSFDGGTTFQSVIQGDQDQRPCDAGLFPKTGSFDFTFEHGFFSMLFRVVDQLNGTGPTTAHELNVDIFTNVSINTVPSIVNNPTLLVSGIREANAAIVVTRNGIAQVPIIFPSSTTWQVTVVLLEGNNVITATATDALDNVATATVQVVLDTVDPAVPTVTQILPAEDDVLEFVSLATYSASILTNEPSQTIIGTKEANTSVILNDTEVIPINEDTEYSIPVTLVEGSNTFVLKSKDSANNESPETGLFVRLDTTPPSDPEIVINDGAGFTLTRDVTLSLFANDATQVKVSEDINFTNAEFIDFDTELFLPFELSRDGGEKTVFAVFKDEAGNETVPVFDTIVLPTTTSTEVERAADMTIQELIATPEDDYLVRLQDHKDGTFSVELYLTLDDAVAQVNRQGFAVSTTTGQQTLSLFPDIGGIDPGGTITVTLIEGAELIIYRFRTDVFDLSEEEIGTTIVYVVEEENSFAGKIQVPIFEGFALGRIIEYAVGGDLRQHRISKAFQLLDEDTAVVKNVVFPTADLDGEEFPINGARFDYPLSSTLFEVISIQEETNAFLITLDKDLERFDATFGYEMLFTRREDLVTDYFVDDTGRVEFRNESNLASGNVRITYQTPSTISSEPSGEFHQITAVEGSEVKLCVVPVNNRILLSDLGSVRARFFHSLEDSTIKAPLQIQVVVNDEYVATSGSFVVAASNARAEIRDFSVSGEQLFPAHIFTDTYTYGSDNTPVDKVEIRFIANSSRMFLDEIQVIAKAAIVESNCRVVVNDEEVHFSDQPVSARFDTYELIVQDGLVDVLCNDICIHTAEVDLENATAALGAGARIAGDEVDAAFNSITTTDFISSSPTTLSLDGRFIDIEASLRQGSLLRTFDIDFLSSEAECPERIFIGSVATGRFLDTATVAIVGIGHREEVLVAQGVGEEDEGEPVDFSALNDPDGRHFRVTSFPIVSDTLEVFLTHNGEELIFEQDTDYQVDFINGCIVLHHPIALGDRLRVRYTSEADSNKPEVFFDLETLTDKFGAPSVENTLSLGAQLAFTNGARRVVAVQALDPSLDSGWANAFESLRKEEVYFVVPIPPSDYTLIIGTGIDHVEEMSSTPQRGERVLLIGETAAVTRDDAAAFRETNRVVFVFPGNASTVLGGETIPVDGRYIAAAYAGKVSSLTSVAEPGMGKTLLGFELANDARFTQLELERLVKEGITTIRKLASGATVHRSITTTNSTSAVLQEQSVLRISDFLAANVRNILETRFVGRPILQPSLIDEIKAATERFLAVQEANRIITLFQSVEARIDSEEPRQVNVSFDVQPAFPLVNIPVAINVVASL